MTQRPVSRPILGYLLALSVLLPLAQGVLFWVGKLLLAMQDTAGEAFVSRVSLGCGVLWVLNLVILVIVLAINSLRQSD
jgi:hypothetical protein